MINLADKVTIQHIWFKLLKQHMHVYDITYKAKFTINVLHRKYYNVLGLDNP